MPSSTSSPYPHSILPSGLHKTLVGRSVYNGILDAALCMLEEVAQVDDQQAVAALLGYNRNTMREIQERLSDVSLCQLLDTTRDTRCTAFSRTVRDQIEMAWEMFTDPAPDLVARFRIAAGEYISHAVHWKRHSSKKTHKMMLDKIGTLCGLAVFKELRPWFVREAGYAACLYPYCFVMGLLMDAYVILMKEV